ncbi:MAG: ABC transporter permease [Treponema sp.]|nr:ABC transporter permease [Treponema sp.]
MSQAKTVNLDEISNKIWGFIRTNGDQVMPYIILLVMIVLIYISMPFANLLSLDWLGIKTDQSLSLILAATGQSMVMMIQGVDLSIGGVISLSNSISALYMGIFLGGSIIGIIAMVVLMALMGFICGAINGFLVVRFRVQPFIVTLATWSVWRGLALWVLPTDGGDPPNAFISFTLSRPFGIPVSLLLIVLLLIFWGYLKNTRFGVSVYALGSNEQSAYYNGINVNKIKILVFSMSGMFSALAGIFRTAQVASGSPTAGNEFILLSLCASVVGGINIAGGRGGVPGTIVGCFIMKMLQDVLQFAGVSTYWTALFQGILLIVVVTITSVNIIFSRKRRMEVKV